MRPVLFILFFSFHLAADSPTNTPPIRQTGPGQFQIGLVTVDASKREISFPASVNMREGAVEYLLVSSIGKLHESIFKTEAEPFHIHTAVLLLLGPLPTNSPAKAEITISLPDKKIPAASSVLDLENKAPLPNTTWNYIGSRMVDKTFIAQRDGSIISLITDPDSLLESPAKNRANDENWQPQTSTLPEVGQRASFSIIFLQEKK